MTLSRQTIKKAINVKSMIYVGIALSFLYLSFMSINADRVYAASKQAETACKRAANQTTNSAAKKAWQNNLDACYYGYDQVGPVQNAVPKCRDKYPNTNNDKQGVCIGGSTMAKSAASKPPGIKRCERDDIKDTKQCKKAYRKCNDKKTKTARDNCKKEVISNHKKPAGGGGGAAADDNTYEGSHLCGNIRTENNGTTGKLSDDNYYSKFDFGCLGEKGPPGMNPINDLAFALLRFLSVGVGIAVVLAVIGSGIQYSASEGNAEVSSKAKKRIRSALIGLGVYVFAFSLFQFLVPGGIFKPGTMWISIELIVRLL